MAKEREDMLKMTIALLAGLLAGSMVLSGNEAANGQDKNEAVNTTARTVDSDDARAADSNAEKNEHAADESAIRKNAAAFVKAYQAGDAKALAEHFAEDAECVHESNLCCRGRAEIEQTLAEFFEANPGCKLEKTIESIRFVSPDVAIEDGTTQCECADGSSCVEGNYTTVHVRKDGKWLVARVHDRDSRDLKEHSLQLEQLAWLQGNWVDEGDDAVVHFSCEPIDNGNFLMRSFRIEIAGQEGMTGTQRIGWDPLTGKLRAWIFDSSGSFGDGVWYRVSDEEFTSDVDSEIPESETVVAGDAEGAGEAEVHGELPANTERWVLRVNGVLADGKTASSTSIYTRVDDHTMTWQSVDHEIAGVHQPDSEIITIVRKAADPDATTSVEQR